jgi:hypothetical protein
MLITLVHRYSSIVSTGLDSYRPRVYARQGPDGIWDAWIVFFRVGGGRVIATDRQKAAASFAALTVWAAGLTDADLDLALQRALELEPLAELEEQLAHLQRLESEAQADAAEFQLAADSARADAADARKKRESTEEKLEDIPKRP